MRLSEDRTARLAHRIADSLLDDEHVDLEIDEDRFRFLIENKLLEQLQLEDKIDEEAALWIHKHKPRLVDGTPEFEIELDKTKKKLADSKGYVLY